MVLDSLVHSDETFVMLASIAVDLQKQRERCEKLFREIRETDDEIHSLSRILRGESSLEKDADNDKIRESLLNRIREMEEQKISKQETLDLMKSISPGKKRFSGVAKNAMKGSFDQEIFKLDARINIVKKQLDDLAPKDSKGSERDIDKLREIAEKINELTTENSERILEWREEQGKYQATKVEYLSHLRDESGEEVGSYVLEMLISELEKAGENPLAARNFTVHFSPLGGAIQIYFSDKDVIFDGTRHHGHFAIGAYGETLFFRSIKEKIIVSDNRKQINLELSAL
jgi:DNA-binding Lrp family transcriptional regulator